MDKKKTGAVLNFSDLIVPINADAFFSDYWERKPLHIKRGDQTYYHGILTLENVEPLISNGDLRFPAIRLARNGMYYPPEAYSRNIRFGDDFFNGVPDVEMINREYSSGATIALPAIHRIWEPLGELCHAIERCFDHPAHANVYITPGNTTGFIPHYDTHEVFILQIAGKKHWRVFDPPLPLPHRTQTFSPQGYVPATPVLELDLEPGDLLYLPRGYVHSASTTDSCSAHVTLGITVFTWVELVSELLLSAKSRPEFRRSLPPGFARSRKRGTALKDELIRLFDNLRSTADYDALIDAFTQRIGAGFRDHEHAFVADITLIGPHTELTAPRKNTIRIMPQGQTIAVDYAGRKLVLSRQYQPTLEAICARSTFRPQDLPRHLDEETQLRFIRYLHDQGFLTRASSENNQSGSGEPKS